MKIQILSDLHNEFLRGRSVNPEHIWKGEIPVTDADLIILAGDIDVGTKGMEWAIRESERLDKPIIYVAGNHEYYAYEIHDLNKKITELAQNTNVTFLNPGEVIFDNVRIIGGTLWTDYKAYPAISQSDNMHLVGNALNDHSVISINNNGKKQRFTPDDALLLHAKDLTFITRKLEEPFDGKTIVVTHHGPHMICQHQSFNLSPMSTGFHSDLSQVFNDYSIDVWIYGHTHSNLDTVVSDTRIVSNQTGYPSENITSFMPGFCLDI